jgi:hypothetical protein
MISNIFNSIFSFLKELITPILTILYMNNKNKKEKLETQIQEQKVLNEQNTNNIIKENANNIKDIKVNNELNSGIERLKRMKNSQGTIVL